MRKFNTIFWATGSILSIILIIPILFIDNDYLYFGGLITLLIINMLAFKVKVDEKKIEKKILDIYYKSLDPETYLIELEKENTKKIQTKGYKLYYLLRKCDGLFNLGKYDKAKSILNELSTHENEMNDTILSMYYQGWFEYFLEYGQFEKCGVLLEQLQKLSTTTRRLQYKMLINSTYLLSLCKFNALTNRDKANTEGFFKMLCKQKVEEIYTVKSMYYLGIIALNDGDLEKAKRRFEYVNDHGNKLYIAKKAKEYYEKL